MPDQDGETSRTVVKTHVPAYQKRIWVDHADELGMSQSEFLRTMVQAGRRGFDPGRTVEGRSSESTGETGETAGELATRIEAVLADSGPLSWDELVTALTDGLEDRLEDTLQTLQEEDRVRYSGRDGGYTLNEGRS
jgi:Family of unknown function (DUF5805)